MESLHTELVVLGAGPGGYAAAFRAADRGRNVLLVDADARLGGVCLNRGCIPSKALLHATEVVRTADAMERQGINFGRPQFDLNRLRAWKDTTLEELGQGIAALAARRGVRCLRGRGRFEGSKVLAIQTEVGLRRVIYEHAVIAVGSKPAIPAAWRLDATHVMTSDVALEIRDIPKDLLVIGGGYIGMELGTVYATLGSRVVLVEALDRILIGADADLTRPVVRAAERLFARVQLSTKVGTLTEQGAKVVAVLHSPDGRSEETYDRVLVCVGRVANCDDLGLEQTQVTRDAAGFITVNASQQTADQAIYAIGDVVGAPLLAHKASRDARIAIDAITGKRQATEPTVMPAVVYTDPEIAWCGLTEADATQQGREVRVVRYPWSASGRAHTLARTDGLTKLIIDPQSERLLGIGIVGAGAGELISEGVIAIDMRATARDLAQAVHPHPTLSETLMECAQLFYGEATHAMPPRAGRVAAR